MRPKAAELCSFAAQRFIEKKIGSPGILCLLLIEAGRVGSIKRILEGLIRFFGCLKRANFCQIEKSGRLYHTQTV